MGATSFVNVGAAFDDGAGASEDWAKDMAAARRKDRPIKRRVIGKWLPGNFEAESILGIRVEG